MTAPAPRRIDFLSRQDEETTLPFTVLDVATKTIVTPLLWPAMRHVSGQTQAIRIELLEGAGTADSIVLYEATTADLCQFIVAKMHAVCRGLGAPPYPRVRLYSIVRTDALRPGPTRESRDTPTANGELAQYKCLYDLTW